METKKIDVGEVAERLGRPVILNIRKTIHSKRKRNRVTVNNVGEYEKLSISYVVDNLPFSKMLSLGENAKPEDSIPFVTRAYEERYMRPAQITEEDNCVMGDECECMHIDENKKFIGVNAKNKIKRTKDNNERFRHRFSFFLRYEGMWAR